MYFLSSILHYYFVLHEHEKQNYSHTKRKGLKFAYSLARHAIHILDYVVWMKFVPLPSFIVFQVDLVIIS